MAGDWIKFELSTMDKPEVCQIADLADIDPDAVVGKLMRVWGWFDQQTESGNAPSVSKKLLDRLVGVSGFCEFMQSVGWMVDSDGIISLPNFDRHNGKTAKNRVLTAKRVANHKVKTNAETNAPIVSDALPKEEKRREEKKEAKQEQDQKTTAAPRRDWLAELIEHGVNEKHARDWLEVRRGKKAKMTDTVIDGIKREARRACVSFGEAIRISAESGWQGFKADWVNKPAANGGGQFMTKQERIEAANQKVLEEMNAAADAMLAQQAGNNQPSLDDQGFLIEGDFFHAD